MLLRTVTTATVLTILLSPTAAFTENLNHLEKLLSTQNCQNCNLVNAGLVRADLAGAQLQGANLANANLSRANLSGANLKGANLTGASLHGANLTGANLTGATLEGTDLRNAYLNHVKLEDSSLESAYIKGAINVPIAAGSAEQFYRIAAAEAEEGNYETAIEYCNRAIRADQDYAPAYLGRGVANYRLGNEAEATQDAQLAADLFAQQNNLEGVQASQRFLNAMEFARKQQENNNESGGLNRAFTSVGSLLFRFLF